MSVNFNSDVSAVSGAYAAYATTVAPTAASSGASGASSSGAQGDSARGSEAAAVYEKGAASGSKLTYKKGMSEEERANLVQSLKNEQADRHSQLVKIAQEMISGQANAFGKAFDMWGMLREGKFTVDAQTKAKAQEDVSEDGYYGVKQTSERLFDFARALAGDDPDKLKKMQDAIEKGYKQAEKTWGGELPDISKKTLEATNKLFDDYYKSQEAAQTSGQTA